MADEKKNQPAELDKAEEAVTQAGGRLVEALPLENGLLEVSFVIPRGGSDHGPYTCIWDPHESPTLLYNAVLLKKPRVVVVEMNNRAGK